MDVKKLSNLIDKIVKESVDKYLTNDTILERDESKDFEIRLRTQTEIEDDFKVKMRGSDNGELFAYPTSEPGKAWNMKRRVFVDVYDARMYKNWDLKDMYYKDAIAQKSVIEKVLNKCIPVSKSKVGNYNGYIQKLSNIDSEGKEILPEYQITKMFVVYSDLEDPLLFQKLKYAKDYCFGVGIFKESDNLKIEESEKQD